MNTILDFYLGQSTAKFLYKSNKLGHLARTSLKNYPETSLRDQHNLTALSLTRILFTRRTGETRLQRNLTQT